MAENTTIRSIARYAAGIRPDVAPRQAAAVARALLDTVAVAATGRTRELPGGGTGEEAALRGRH